VDTNNPEIERLWAMSMVEQIEVKQQLGALPGDEAQNAIENLGVQYHIVTDHTSMLVLDDSTYAKRGIERRTLQRNTIERQAQSLRAQQPIQNHQVDQKTPTYEKRAPGLRFGGGGALDIEDLNTLLIALLIGASYYVRRHLKHGP
jgi:Ca-activated chloride channel family protein